MLRSHQEKQTSASPVVHEQGDWMSTTITFANGGSQQSHPPLAGFTHPYKIVQILRCIK